LDVGCGTGDLTLAAAKRAGSGGTVCGIDASPEMIDVARRKARNAHRAVQFRVEPVESLSFPDGSFDIVLSSLMMHHLPGELKRQALAEIGRVLRPGGRVVVVDFQPSVSRPRIWQPGVLAAHIHGTQRQTPQAAEAEAGLPVVASLLRETGFAGVETGSTRSQWLGYARAHMPE